MSHFVGIVFGHNVEDNLAPYDETLEVPEYIDKTSEELKQWAIEKVECYRSYIKEHENSTDKYELGTVITYLNILKDYNNFETEEDYQRLISNFYTLDKDGNSISTYNPESQWDWYVEGGRWNNCMLHADGYDTNSAYLDELTEVDTPYCFVDLDGNWHEKGSMGWWGVSFGDKEEDVWEKEFRDYLESVPKDTLLTVIDFHI